MKVTMQKIRLDGLNIMLLLLTLVHASQIEQQTQETRHIYNPSQSAIDYIEMHNFHRNSMNYGNNPEESPWKNPGTLTPPNPSKTITTYDPSSNPISIEYESPEDPSVVHTIWIFFSDESILDSMTINSSRKTPDLVEHINIKTRDNFLNMNINGNQAATRIYLPKYSYMKSHKESSKPSYTWERNENNSMPTSTTNNSEKTVPENSSNKNAQDRNDSGIHDWNTLKKYELSCDSESPREPPENDYIPGTSWYGHPNPPTDFYCSDPYCYYLKENMSMSSLDKNLPENNENLAHGCAPSNNSDSSNAQCMKSYMRNNPPPGLTGSPVIRNQAYNPSTPPLQNSQKQMRASSMPPLPSSQNQAYNSPNPPLPSSQSQASGFSISNTQKQPSGPPMPPLPSSQRQTHDPNWSFVPSAKKQTHNYPNPSVITAQNQAYYSNWSFPQTPSNQMYGPPVFIFPGFTAAPYALNAPHPGMRYYRPFPPRRNIPEQKKKVSPLRADAEPFQASSINTRVSKTEDNNIDPINVSLYSGEPKPRK
ncbi:hypothetical protein NEAUS04_1381 [Nematocida ausubeli]|nr:hypothetical protein NEAUS04_1381 [Nematocida ausubeli]